MTLFNNIMGNSNMISSAGNVASSFAQGNDWKPSLQSGFGIDEEDSDTKQSIKGALNGAKLGMSFGGVGAGVGALLGLGASFLDDI